MTTSACTFKKPIVNRCYLFLLFTAISGQSWSQDQVLDRSVQQRGSLSTDASLPVAAFGPRRGAAKSGEDSVQVESDLAAPLTERDAVEEAVERPSFSDVIEGEVAAAEGRAKSASAYPNPQLSYMREQTFGALGTGEDYLSIAQVIDLGNRRGLHGRAGKTRTRAAEQDGEAARLTTTVEVRLRFYEVLYRQSRVVALDTWAARIDDALEIVKRREARGDAATYDRRRLEREQAVATGRLETEGALLDGSRGRLRAVLGEKGNHADLAVTGTLLPDSDPAELPRLLASSVSRPDLVALELRTDAALVDRKAASRFWVPDIRIEGGWKGVDAGPLGRTDGFLLGASLAVPLWDRSAGLSRSAEGEARALRGRRELLESELVGELDGARIEAVRLRQAAKEFHKQTTMTSGDLARIAAAGYEGGELGLLELLDAYRGAIDDALTALDMEFAARRARIEVDRLTGAKNQ
jgi:outer membrane protein, heavy metal efflux system